MHTEQVYINGALKKVVSIYLAANSFSKTKIKTLK